MHFNVRAAKQLKAGEHLVVDGCPGLRLMAKGARLTWTYRFEWTDGLMKQVAIGHYPEMPFLEAGDECAVARWKKLSARRAQGEDPRLIVKGERKAKGPQPAAAPAPAVRLVRDVIAEYQTGHLPAARDAANCLKGVNALSQLLADEPEFADMPAHELTRGLAYAVLDRRKQTPTAAAALRSMLGQAWENDLDADRLPENTPNWWRQVLKGKLKSMGKIIGGQHVGKQRRTLRGPDVGALIAWLPNMYLEARDMLTLYLWTLTRGVEISRMQADQVSHEKDGWWWTIPKGMTKNARFADAVDLRVPLFGRAQAVVRRRIKAVGGKGLLFVDAEGQLYQQHRLSTYIYDLQPYSAKVRDGKGGRLVIPVTGWTPHNLRRTCRTLLAGLGCSDEIGEAIIGHMPEEIVATYNTYTYDKERRHWLGLLDQHLEVLAKAAGAGD